METATQVLEYANVWVRGAPMESLPSDLFIPSDPLQISLEQFQGPLDLLLYLIRKQNFDILDIPIAVIADQYVRYIEVMEQIKLELAAEYLLMAAVLAEIKSRLLLPKPAASQEEEDDPRQMLVARLQAYEQFKLAAESLDALPRLERDYFLSSAKRYDLCIAQPEPVLALESLVRAFSEALAQSQRYKHHVVEAEFISVEVRIVQIMTRLATQAAITFEQLLVIREGRMGVVVTFIALLELLRQQRIQLRQEEPYQPLYIEVKYGTG